ncbi:hypothetical protein LBMAG21_11100 [Armatimonadota bacterium]|nr:hypothetical protein LBMAG21_11100 [Armatimonadota bacterium]
MYQLNLLYILRRKSFFLPRPVDATAEELGREVPTCRNGFAD